ncbi:MAG: hypothetical protein ABSC01_11115 [Verrucomicrobiota bacterium]
MKTVTPVCALWDIFILRQWLFEIGLTITRAAWFNAGRRFSFPAGPPAPAVRRLRLNPLSNRAKESYRQAVHVKTTQRFCPVCNQLRLFTKPNVNHLAHAIISLFLCCTWVPVWIIICLVNAGKPWRCSVCGNAQS